MMIYGKELFTTLGIMRDCRGKMFAGERIELVVISEMEFYKVTGTDNELHAKFIKYLDTQLYPTIKKHGKIIVLTKFGDPVPIEDWFRITKTDRN